MSRSSWNIFYLESGDTWVADSSIFRPNDVFSPGISSTESSFQLLDGSFAHVTPEVKSSKKDLTFVWYYVDSTLKSKIETYINSGTDLKIVTHNGSAFYGRFIDISPDWLVGTDGDYYDITAQFKNISSLEV